MLILYYKPACPFSARVLRANQTIGAKLILRDISTEPAARAELIQKGGKSQVPFLEDSDRSIFLYESLDIIAYLEKQYGQGTIASEPGSSKICSME